MYINKYCVTSEGFQVSNFINKTIESIKEN